MTCLVTGASGFIGSALCAHLAAEGVGLVATSRGGAVTASGIATRPMDPAHPQARLLEGVDSVVHLAGVAHQHAAPEMYDKVNVEATLALARAALEAGVRQFIYFSSVKAMGPPHHESPRTETELTLPVDAYGRSKREAELQLDALCRDGGMCLVILRPCLVYGPSPRANLRLLAGLARWWPLRPPEGGVRSMIGLQDLVSLVSLLVRQPPAESRTWLVADGKPLSAREMYDELRQARGLGPGRQCLPHFLWRFACRLVDYLRGEVGGSTAHKLFAAEQYDASAVQGATGWQPRQCFADVAPAMVEGR
ncbi:NAD-dependent epimerase/dehydratase family protein [Parahaliea maris]|uniref:NAD-dependent epimerase/dehydratase family protein n=1 Tax=Parahaliea maris TaxID=2716870 RepID=A0A5C9A5N3_9GAMM|nr:NAD-dependent epimerase/dehydratase family protein [Parahaliea maris]TXS96225.1 NAD-dependent epimerase/dehydratase family protein [Parahaliea maris]